MNTRLLDIMLFISNDLEPTELTATKIISRAEDDTEKAKLAVELAESYASPFLKFFPRLVFSFSLSLKLFCHFNSSFSVIV